MNKIEAKSKWVVSDEIKHATIFKVLDFKHIQYYMIIFQHTILQHDM